MMNRLSKVIVACGVGFLGTVVGVNIAEAIKWQKHDKDFELRMEKEDLLFEMAKTLARCKSDLKIINNVYLETDVNKDYITFVFKVAEATTKNDVVNAYAEFNDYIAELYRNNNK